VKRKGILGYLALMGVLALVSPSTLQELQIPQFGGYDVPYVPTPPEVVEEMLRLADIKPGDLLYDLGCGDGRIVIAAAKKYEIKAVGIDIDPNRIAESNENAKKEGVADKVQFIQQDLFQADFRNATVVTMYLLTSVNRRLRPKLLAELRPGTRLVSHSFSMGEWKPDKTSNITLSLGGDEGDSDNTGFITIPIGDQRNIYFWVVPANLTGRWEWDLADGSSKRHYTLQTAQQFQELNATGTAGNWTFTISDVELSGDDLKFQLDAEAGQKITSFLYRGTVRGDTITGTVTPADNPKAAPLNWRAVRDPKTIMPLDKEP
jgi:SAM-dependent methyltransferase